MMADTEGQPEDVPQPEEVTEGSTGKNDGNVTQETQEPCSEVEKSGGTQSKADAPGLPSMGSVDQDNVLDDSTASHHLVIDLDPETEPSPQDDPQMECSIEESSLRKDASNSASASSDRSSPSKGASHLALLEGRKFKCSMCGSGTSFHCASFAEFLFHLNKHIPFGLAENEGEGRTKFSYQSSQYQCSSCAFATQFRLIFREHVRHHMLKVPYYCGYCRGLLPSINDAEEHMSQQHPSKVCKLMVYSSDTLNDVMKKLGPKAPPTDSFMAMNSDQANTSQDVLHGSSESPIVIGDDDDFIDSVPQSETSEKPPTEATDVDPPGVPVPPEEGNRPASGAIAPEAPDTVSMVDPAVNPPAATVNLTAPPETNTSASPGTKSPVDLEVNPPPTPVEHQLVPGMPTASPGTSTSPSPVMNSPMDLGANPSPAPEDHHQTSGNQTAPFGISTSPAPGTNSSVNLGANSSPAPEGHHQTSVNLTAPIGSSTLTAPETNFHVEHHQASAEFPAAAPRTCASGVLSVNPPTVPEINSPAMPDVSAQLAADVQDGDRGGDAVATKGAASSIGDDPESTFRVCNSAASSPAPDSEHSVHAAESGDASSSKKLDRRRRKLKRHRLRAAPQAPSSEILMVVSVSTIIDHFPGAQDQISLEATCNPKVKTALGSRYSQLIYGFDQTGQLVCKEHTISVHSETMFRSHVFNDIHSVLANVTCRYCGKEANEGNSSCTQRAQLRCPMVDAIVDYLVKQRDHSPHNISRGRKTLDSSRTPSPSLSLPPLNAPNPLIPPGSVTIRDQDGGTALPSSFDPGNDHSLNEASPTKKRKRQRRKMIKSPGIYNVINRRYHCFTCNYCTLSSDYFQLHVSGHLHGTSNSCCHAPHYVKANRIPHCLALNAVMKYLTKLMHARYKGKCIADTIVRPILVSHGMRSTVPYHKHSVLRHTQLLARLKRGVLRFKCRKRPLLTNVNDLSLQNGFADEGSHQVNGVVNGVTDNTHECDIPKENVESTEPMQTNTDEPVQGSGGDCVELSQDQAEYPDGDLDPDKAQDPPEDAVSEDGSQGTNDLASPVPEGQNDPEKSKATTEDESSKSSEVEDDTTPLGTCSRFQGFSSNSRNRRSLQDVLNHLRSQRENEGNKTSTKPYKCGLPGCSYSGSDENAFRIHTLTEHSSDDTFPCAFCDKKFFDVDGLVSHVTANHVSKSPSGSDSKLYKCMFGGCSESYTRLGEFKAHLMTSHGDEIQYQCCFCPQQCGLVDGLVEHIQTHITKVMKCPYCGKAYFHKSEILNHLRDLHPGQPKKINIGVRVMTSSSANHSVKHTASQETPKLIAALSKDTSQTEGELQQSQTQAAPSVAGDAMDSDSVMSESTVFESGRRPSRPRRDASVGSASSEQNQTSPLDSENDLQYKCRQCSYHCNTSSTLAAHENLHKFGHNNNSQYLCKLCPYSAISKYVFHQHLQHHEGRHIVRYYECPHCKWSTNKMDKIEDHLTERHPNVPFKFEVVQDIITYKQDMVVCPFCRGFYIWRAEFLKHIVHTHKSEAAFQAHISGIPENDLEMVKKISSQYAKSRQRFDGSHSSPRVASPASNSKASPAYGNQPVFPGLSSPDLDSDSMTGGTQSVQIYKYHCEFCSFSSNDQGALDEHLATHEIEDTLDLAPSDDTNEMPILTTYDQPPSTSSVPQTGGGPQLKLKLLSCSLCPYTTINQKNLYNHRSMHKKYENLQEGYACPYCQYKGPDIKGATFHIHKYHPGEDGIAIRISGGVLLSARKDGSGPSKRVARKSSTKQAVKSLTGSESHSYQRMGSWAESYKSPYATTSISENITPQAVPALPKALGEDWIQEFERSLPATMIFKEPVKCQKCSFSSKVRYNLLRHMKIHTSQNTSPGLQSPPSSTKASPASQIEGESFSTDDGEESGSLLDRVDKSSRYCTRVPHKNLYQCKECRFMDRFPFMVRKHYLHKHSKKMVYKCSYCDFMAAEGPAIRTHCQREHPGMEIRAIRTTQGAPVSSGTASGEGVATNIQQQLTIEDATTGEIMQMPGAEMLGNAYDELVGPYMEKLTVNNGQKCKLCGYTQEGISPLKRHIMAVHLKFYPFKCKYCWLSMVEVNKLKKHIKMKHPDKPIVILKKKASDYHQPETPLGVRIKSEPGVIQPAAPEVLEKTIKPEPVTDFPGDLLEEDEGNGEDLDDMNDIPHLSPVDKEMSAVIAKQAAQAAMLNPEDDDGTSPKKGMKVHKCAYCGYFSRWSGIDAKRHVFSQHLRRREYTCRYCNYEGNRPGSVRSHLARVHPNMAGGIRHRRAEMECVKPIEENENAICYAVVTDQDVPILDEESLMDPDVSESIVKSFSSNLVHSMSQSKKTPEPLKVTTKPTPVKQVFEADELLGPNEVLMETGGSAASPPSGRRHDIIWRCKLCHTLGNKIKVKTHVLAKHMKLKPLRCPYCSVYIWKRDAIRRHVQIEHPGKEVAFINVVAEKVEYINKYIESLSGTPRAKTTWNCLESQQTRDAMQGQEDFSEAEQAKALYHLEDPSGDVSNMNQADLEAIKKPGKTVDLWRCKLCGLVDSKNRQRYHIAVHHLKLKPVQCPHCEDYFWKWESTKKHIMREHPGKSLNVVNVLSLHAADIEKNVEKIDPMASSDIADAIVQAAAAEEQSCSKMKDLSSLAPIAARDMPMRCTLCGMVGNRARVRYHIICHHMKLKPIKCGHCSKYFYKKQLAVKHQARDHSDLPPLIQHVALDHSQYLDKNMEMVEAPQTKSFSHLLSKFARDRRQEEENLDEVEEQTLETPAPPSMDEDFVPCMEGNEYLCDKCPHRTTVLPAIKAHRKLHVMFGCCYCPFKATTAAKVQNHCLARHKGLPITYQPVDHFKTQSLPKSPVPAEPKPTEDSLQLDFLESDQLMGDDSLLGEPQQPIFPMREPPVFPGPAPEPPVFPEPMPMSPNMFDTNDESGQEASRSVLNITLPKRGKGPFRCRHCNSICLYRENMKRHMRKHHPNMPKFDFDPVKDLDQIEMVGRKAALANRSATTINTTDEYIPMEDVGDVDFPDESSAAEVADSESESAVTPSSVSGSSSRGPISHYKCCLCSYTTRDVAPTAMRHHVMIHFNYRPFACSYCRGFRGVRSFTVKKHIKSCHPGKSFNILEEKDEELEQKVMKHFLKIRKGKLVPHTQSFQNRTKTVYECQECGLRQESRRDIRRHLCRHIGYKPCLCAMCEFQEPDSGSMKKHFRVKHKKHGVKFIMKEDEEKEKLLEEMMKASTKTISLKSRDEEEEVMISDEAESDYQTYNAIANVLPESENDLAEPVEEPEPPKPVKPQQVATARKSTYASIRASAKWIEKLKVGMVIRRCPLCDYFHIRGAKVSEHMLLRHGPKQIKCYYCSAEFNYPSHVTKHNVMKHPNMPMRYQKLPDVKAVPLPPVVEEIYQGMDQEGIPVTGSAGVSPKRPKTPGSKPSSSSPPPKRTRTSSPVTTISQPPIPPLKIKLEPHLAPSPAPSSMSETSDAGNTTVYFEGEPFNIPLQTDAEGMYHCIHCVYSTVNKEHMKMHAVSHYPPKWQCGFCPKKYHMQFRVRRHMTAAHPDKPIIFLNVETGERMRYEGKRAPLVTLPEGEQSSPAIKYCCHLCSFKAGSQQELASHLKTGHFDGDPAEESQSADDTADDEDEEMMDDGELDDLEDVIFEDDLLAEQEISRYNDEKLSSTAAVRLLNLESLSNDELQMMLDDENITSISW